MKKSKGFLLIESLVVATFISATLIFVYTQFKVINDSYEQSFKYNTVTGIYKANNLRDYLYDAMDPNVYSDLMTEDYIIFNCDAGVVSTPPYCSSLYNALKIEQVFFFYNDTKSFKNLILMDSTFSQGVLNFLDYIKDKSSTYRMVIEYKDGTYASLNL